MRRYIQIESVNLTGIWLDEGIDAVDQERFKCLTAMSQIEKLGTRKRFEAVTQLATDELKISLGHMDGAHYVCTECFVQEPSRAVLEPLINLAWGVLDLRNPEQPKIVGTWQQLELRDAEAVEAAMLRPGVVPVSPDRDETLICRSRGSFEFTRIRRSFENAAGQDPAVRAEVGFTSEEEFYIVEPLDA